MQARQPLRRAVFSRALAAQRAYVQQSAACSQFGLIVPEAFVRGIRALGYRSNGDAIAELIDNAIQAQADHIGVVFGYQGSSSTKKPVQLAVLDNGHGMEPDMIRLAVMWGGTHRENDRGGLGRYGYGLPCSSVSLGRRFTVISKIRGGGIHGVTLDLDAITGGDYTNDHGEIIVPDPQRAELPAWLAEQVQRSFPEGWTSGTIILIEKLDRLQWTTSQGLRGNLCRQFGVTYHKLRGEAALFVDGSYVEPIDPLFLTPGFHLFDLDEDRAQRLDSVRVEVRDPESKAYRGALTLRYAWFPPSFGSADKNRDAVALNANARFSILKDYHGLIFSRNGRLIDVQTRTPWTAFINNDRYIKVEIEFSAKLDELFGVATSKQQVTVSPIIWDLLRQAGLPKAIEQLRVKVREARLVRRARCLIEEPGLRRISEHATMATAAAAGGLPLGHQWGLGFRTAPYRLDLAHVPAKPFFWVSRDEASHVLHLNTAHRFHEQVYDRPTASPDIRANLEVMLFSLGAIALQLPPDQRSVLLALIERWSRRLDEVFPVSSTHLGDVHDKDVGEASWPNGPT